MKPVHIPESVPGIADLQMENDLLTHENRLLRARLDGAARQGTPDATEVADHAASSRDEEHYRQAYYDLRWFVQRLNGSPLGIVLRRWRGFRVLVDRYGRTGR